MRSKLITSACRAHTGLSSSAPLRSTAQLQFSKPATPFLARSSLPTRPNRTLHTSPRLHKQKGGKQNSKHNAENAASRSQAAGDDPFDFEKLQAELEKTVSKLKDDLGKLRQGGRIGTELVEGLRVTLKDTKEVLRVGDLAQVVPKGGRSMVLLVGEEAVCLFETFCVELSWS